MSTIFYQIYIFNQMIALQKLWKVFFILYGKEGVSSRDGQFVWFSIFFNAYQAFWCGFQSQQDKPYLAFICMFKGNNKNIRTRHEICLKLKLKNKYTETTLSNGVLMSLLLLWTYLLLSSSVFIVDFEHLNDAREC